VKTWNIYLIDDGLEENHETFSVTLKSPKNAVLGQRTSASVEIIDPRGGKTSSRVSRLEILGIGDIFARIQRRCLLCCLLGRCNPDDLKVEEDGTRLPPLPPGLPDPPRPKEEDAVTDIEAELLWENRPHPPRGDVPNRRPYLDYGEVEPQDQAAHDGYSHVHYQGRQLPGESTGSTGSTGLQVSVASSRCCCRKCKVLFCISGIFVS